MSERKAEMIEMRPSGGNRLRLVFYAPTRGLIGYQGDLMTDTKRHGDHEPPVPRLRCPTRATSRAAATAS